MAKIGTGKIYSWWEEKGYGFIRTGEGDVFFHVRQFAYHHRRPRIGDEVAFYWRRQQNRRFAERVLLAEHAHALPQSEAYDRHDVPPFIVEAAIYVFLDACYFIILASVFLPLALSGLCISFMTFYLFWHDKKAAQSKRFRIPEKTLYLSALLGGWPGALIARQLFRHKINNSHFIVFFWACIIIHFSMIYAMLLYFPLVPL